MPCAGVPGSLRPKADFDHRDSMIVLSTTSNVSDTKEAEAIDTLASCPSSVLSVRRESQVLIRSRISELVFNLDELSGQELPRPKSLGFDKSQPKLQSNCYSDVPHAGPC